MSTRRNKSMNKCLSDGYQDIRRSFSTCLFSVFHTNKAGHSFKIHYSSNNQSERIFLPSAFARIHQIVPTISVSCHHFVLYIYFCGWVECLQLFEEFGRKLKARPLTSMMVIILPLKPSEWHKCNIARLYDMDIVRRQSACIASPFWLWIK